MPQAPPDTAPKTTRIEARVNPETRALLKRAADLQGRSLSDFVVSVARAAALQTIETMETIQLSHDAQALFVQLLLDPPEPNDALRHAVRTHEELIGPV